MTLSEDRKYLDGRMAKRLNILLVSPKSYEESFDQKLAGYSLLPYSIVYLVNYLKKENLCNVDYVDLVMEPTENLFRRISEEHFDLIGFTSTTEARFSTIDKIGKVRELSPKTKIVTGGYFFSKTADASLRNVSEIDYIVRGEGELTLAHLVQMLSAEDPNINSIEGLSFRMGEKIIHNLDRQPGALLEKFLLDYDLIRKPGYDLLFPMKNWEEQEEMKAFPIMLGRGCNQKCIFCTHRHLPYRTFKLQQIISQIDWAMKRLGTRCFMFTDPSFSERGKFVVALCEYLIHHQYPIRWYCEARADISPDLLQLMNRAGCISIDFALESGSERVLQSLRKRLSLNEVDLFSRTCHELGIRSTFFTMVSLPGEREEDFLKTYQVIKRLYEYGMETSIAPLIIYPGTDLETLAKDRGIIPRDFSWLNRTYRCPFSFIHPREGNMPHYLEHLSEEQVENCLHLVNGFYHRQRIRKRIWRGIESFAQIRSIRELTEFITDVREKLVETGLRKMREKLLLWQSGKHRVFQSAPYSPILYERLMNRCTEGEGVRLAPFTETLPRDSSEISVYVRHDIDTSACIANLNRLLEIDREFHVPSGVYFRVDGTEYDLAEHRQTVGWCRESGFEVGLHTVCYLDDDPLAAFKKETAVFERKVGFRPTSFTLHGLGTLRYGARMQFVREIRGHLEELGYKFTDCLPQYRQYTYILQDCHLRKNNHEVFIFEDFLRFPRFLRRGDVCLILTHPCYW